MSHSARQLSLGLMAALVALSLTGCVTAETQSAKPTGVWGYVASAKDASLTVDPNRASTVGLVVTRVVAPGNSLLVVTSAGMPVGVAAVKPGVTDEVKIPLTGVMASSKITVMLYLDKGRAGVFDANIMNPTASPDRPVFVGGQQVVSHVSAWQAGQASQAGSATLDVFDQAETSGTVLITHVATPGPSWITVSADASGVPGAILGSRSLGATDTVDVKVPLNNTTYRGPVWVGLHVDAGTTGVLEYDRFGSFSSSPDQLYTVNDKELLLHVKLQ